jgi:hypothetical protein
MHQREATKQAGPKRRLRARATAHWVRGVAEKSSCVCMGSGCKEGGGSQICQHGAAAGASWELTSPQMLKGAWCIGGLVRSLNLRREAMWHGCLTGPHCRTCSATPFSAAQLPQFSISQKNICTLQIVVVFPVEVRVMSLSSDSGGGGGAPHPWSSP